MSNGDRSIETTSPNLVAWVRLVGIAAVGIGVTALLLTCFVSSRTDGIRGFVPETRGLIQTLLYCCGLLFGGIGSLFLRKSGLLIVAILFAHHGISLGIGSIGDVPFPWVILNLLVAAGLLIPCLLVLKGWKIFVW